MTLKILYICTKAFEGGVGGHISLACTISEEKKRKKGKEEKKKRRWGGGLGFYED